ncbi:TIR domain-containing protein [Bradyrhizobium ontarionense]|uniref:TIR domain-containing protein n=1 Tax=Bradyrhizobium ontarionense TaxID=2898149 RepID=A0ABY3RHI2_9BRAD|nr:TIR domain-containing protein [Bradyrhizobium sp. A19]UFZ06512.1 TIR domain-containing protein [Bradyrhizobium sp. A19]
MANVAEPGKVVAFYSFKGGTGRSMAMANIACLLARETAGRPVLMIDWDLEAPGLHRYFRKHFFAAFHGSEERQDKTPGLIDLFIAIQQRLDEMLPQDDQGAAELIASLPLKDYIITTDIPGLDLIKAGQFDGDYPQKVGSFNWTSLYARSPSLLRHLAARLAADYRYVLIDSRTGLTDTSGICTMLLPEILVTVFTPNRQSLAGVINLVREAGRYRARSDDLRPLVIYPLPSRIEASEPTLRQQWRMGDASAEIVGFQREFEDVFKQIYDLPSCSLRTYFDDVQIQHVPKYAYGEEIAVLAEGTADRLSLTRSFQRFSAMLAAGQLPWATAPAESEALAEDVDDLTNVYERIREQTSAAYLRQAEQALDQLRTRARRFTIGSFAARIAGTIASAAVAFFALAPSLFEGKSTVVAALSVIATVLFSVESAVLGRAPTLMADVSKVFGAIQAFRLKLAPYDKEDALERLRDTVEPVLAHPGDKRPMRNVSVYVSFRRDEAARAGRLAEALRSVIGRENLTFDWDSLPLGANLRRIADNLIAQSDVVLVVIGPGWSQSGRLTDTSDIVRLEIMTALQKNKTVIPVLVGGATMPAESELPADIRELSYRNAIAISDARWDADIIPLIRSIQRLSGTPDPLSAR